MIRGSERIDDYLKALSDDRHTWQKTWESEVNTTVQNDPETIERECVTDPLSPANSDIMVYEKGSYIQRYVYNINGERISSEYSYNHETNRATPGENIISDIAAGDVKKIYYRRSMLDSTLIAVDKEGDIISHVIYDEWGTPLTETRLDENYSGIDNINNFTGYTYDEVLKTYYAQNRFYDPENHRFTQEDRALDGTNWYSYCNSNPLTFVDPMGLATQDWYIKNTDNLAFHKLTMISHCWRNFVHLKELMSILNDDGYANNGAKASYNRLGTKYIVQGDVSINDETRKIYIEFKKSEILNKKESEYYAYAKVEKDKKVMSSFSALYCTPGNTYVEFSKVIEGLGLVGKYQLLNINNTNIQNRKEFIWKYIRNKGIDEIHTAAILGNIGIESKYSPTNAQQIGSKYKPDHDPDYNYNANDSIGYGLAQWTFSSRKQGLLNYANNKKASVGDMVTQLEYLFLELETGEYKNRYNTFLNKKDLKSATEYFCIEIERPGIPHMNRRLKAAREIYDEFMNK